MEDKQKRLRLVAYWLFSTVMIVFAAITTYVFIWMSSVEGSIGDVLMASLPITLVTAIVAGALYAGYYFFIYKKE